MPQRACFLLLAVLAAGAAGIHLTGPSVGPALPPHAIDGNGVMGMPLERYLWLQGIYPVTGVCAGGQCIDWEEAAYRSLWEIPVLMLPGQGIDAFGRRIDAGYVAVATAPRPELSILDVAPTVCGALGLPGRFDGKPVCRVNASQVVVIYVDGLGWYRYEKERPAMKNLSSLGPAAACCVYPSISNVNGAAMLTGDCPERSGVDRWENRTILVDDAIDLALRHGVSAAWIDGPRPPVSLRGGIVRVADTNGDGNFDDEIADRAIAEHQNGVRLLYVHLAETDRTLHESGLYSAQSRAAAVRADARIGRLLGRLRPGTLALVVADHGGHAIAGGRGDHGSLLPEDMLVPFAARVVTMNSCEMYLN